MGRGVQGSMITVWGLASGVQGLGFGRFWSGVCDEWKREARIDRVDLQKKGLMYPGERAHTVEYDPFIKSQLASHN